MKRTPLFGSFIAFGAGVGVALGAAWHQPGVGVVVGVAFGVVGAAIGQMMAARPRRPRS